MIVKESNYMWPVDEIFGQTIQGEGLQIGMPTIFIRFQGCDSRCPWCDTPEAQIAKEESIMHKSDILEAVLDKSNGSKWVTLTGGNPLLYNLTALIRDLHYFGKQIAVETQGTLWKPWILDCDRVAVSPKHFPIKPEQIQALSKLARHPKAYLKVVVFGAEELVFAKTLMETYPNTPMVLQVGNRVGLDNTMLLLKRLAWITEKALKDNTLARVEAILPQLHVLLYGNKKGV